MLEDQPLAEHASLRAFHELAARKNSVRDLLVYAPEVRDELKVVALVFLIRERSRPSESRSHEIDASSFRFTVYEQLTAKRAPSLNTDDVSRFMKRLAHREK